MTKVDYTIPGTKLPTLPSGTRYICSNWRRDGAIGQFTNPTDYFFSFGTTSKDGEEYIQADAVNYSGSNFYLIALSDIENLTKKQYTTPAKEWAYGTYVVFIKPYGNSRIGDVDQIIEEPNSFNGSLSCTVCYCAKERTTTKDSEYTKWIATIEEATEFSKLITNKKYKMKTISYSDAQRIIDIACSTWKNTLFELWGKKIVLKQEVEISDIEYQNMRRACTSEQNRLFDEIFGVDKRKFEIGDWIVPLNPKEPNKGHGRGNRAYQVYNIEVDWVRVYNDQGLVDGNGGVDFDECRLATVEEIKAATAFPDGTPCLVRDTILEEWKLRYANGKGKFYKDYAKSGGTICWKYSMKLDMNNLPVGL